MAPTDRSPWSKILGFGGKSRDHDHVRFDELAAQADARGIAWRDLTADGYRLSSDMYAAGQLVRYDWRWRTNELQRRLDQADRDESGSSG